MRYDLKCSLLDRTFYIECRLADKPKTIGELLNGIESGKIHWQPNYEDKMKRLMYRLSPAECSILDMNHPLDTDFETQKPIRHNINWIPTENLK